VTHEEVRDAYGALADQYIALLGAIEHVHPDDEAFLRRHLGGLTGPVLDLGCGPGHLTAHLASLGVDVRGIDLTPEFVDHARATHPGVRFDLGSLTDLDVPDGTVAGLLAWYSMIHLTPAALDDALAGLRRVLAPGGVLVLGLVEGDDVEPFDHKVVTAYRWPAAEASRRLARAGFVEIDRLQRPADGTQRPQLAIAARAA
jgi:SAM-dependent methyltransferase